MVFWCILFVLSIVLWLQCISVCFSKEHSLWVLCFCLNAFWTGWFKLSLNRQSSHKCWVSGNFVELNVQIEEGKEKIHQWGQVHRERCSSGSFLLISVLCLCVGPLSWQVLCTCPCSGWAHVPCANRRHENYGKQLGKWTEEQHFSFKFLSTGAGSAISSSPAWQTDSSGSKTSCHCRPNRYSI